MNKVEVIINIAITEGSETPTTVALVNEFKDNCTKITNFVINDLADRGELDSSIKKVIITDNYEDAVQEQADLWNIGKYYHTKGRGYLGVGRVVYNQQLTQPERYIFIPSHLGTEKIFPIVLYGLMLEVFSSRILPHQLQSIQLIDLPWTFHNHIEASLPQWIKTYWTRNKIAKEFKSVSSVYRLPDNCYATFVRDLKQFLFEYNSYTGYGQSDNKDRIGIFWDKLFISTDFLISGLLEAAPYYDGDLTFEKSEISPLLNSILKEIRDITEVILHNEPYSVYKLKSAIIALYNYLGINIIEHESAIEIKLIKNPKSYTKDLGIVDVEPRFVCFLDILGFSAMVDEYDQDSSSNILQKIQSSFKEAMQILSVQFQNHEDSDIEYLEYRVFSDCICISLPYFDNQINYTSNLALLLMYVRGLQTSLMTKGVFTRGGIAAGPYYMDENILFSKAMIRAYIIESKEATYPRIVVDKAIFEKLKSYSLSALHAQSVLIFLVRDINDVVFLSPFNSIKNSLDQFKSSMADIRDSLSSVNENDEFSVLIGGLAENVLDFSLSILEDSLDSNPDEAIHEAIRKEIQQQRWKLEIQKSTTAIGSDTFKILEKSLAKYDWLEKFMSWSIDVSLTNSTEFEYYKLE